MGKGSAPKPPDPKETGAAQTGTNIGTAIANNMMGMVDQTNPYGSVSYDQTGTYVYDDPYTNQSYDIPTFSSTVSLSPEQQAIQDQNQGAQLNLAGMANDQSAFVRDYLAEPADFDTSAIEGRLDELGRQRIDPRFAREEDALRTRLANQGIGPGSEAYNREMEAFNQNRNDAYNSLYLTGRSQAFNELATMRNQPLNEIIGMLSGTQIQSPGQANFQPQGAATTDYASLINENYNQRYNNWQQQQASSGALLGGLFKGIGTLATLSDRRMKTNIKQVGTYGKLPVYSFEYTHQRGTHVGFMADEVAKIAPDAVVRIGGLDHVDYGKAMEAAL